MLDLVIIQESIEGFKREWTKMSELTRKTFKDSIREFVVFGKQWHCYIYESIRFV